MKKRMWVLNSCKKTKCTKILQVLRNIRQTLDIMQQALKRDYFLFMIHFCIKRWHLQNTANRFWHLKWHSFRTEKNRKNSENCKHFRHNFACDMVLFYNHVVLESKQKMTCRKSSLFINWHRHATKSNVETEK